MIMHSERLTEAQASEIIEMAWADEVSFDAIKNATGMTEKQVILLMRAHMKPSSFRMWRKRVSNRKSKHDKPQTPGLPDSG